MTRTYVRLSRTSSRLISAVGRARKGKPAVDAAVCAHVGTEVAVHAEGEAVNAAAAPGPELGRYRTKTGEYV